MFDKPLIRALVGFAMTAAFTATLGTASAAAAPEKTAPSQKAQSSSQKKAKSSEKQKKSESRKTKKSSPENVNRAVPHKVEKIELKKPPVPEPPVVSETKTELASEVVDAMKKAKVLPANLSVSIVPLSHSGFTFSMNAAVPRTPASIEKVVTSALALDILGPAKVWRVSAVSEAEVEDGVLKGDLFLVGNGDPTFVAERFWLLLDNLRAAGIKKIEGNLVVDRSLFRVPKHDPFSFDGEGNRSYNLGPDALLVNYRSQIIQFRPDKEKDVAYLYPSPRIEGINIPATMPLSKEPCGSWRYQIKPDYSDPSSPKFLGKYPLKCGNKDLLYTSLSANKYLETIFRSFWKQSGGEWNGKLVTGKKPEEAHTLAANYSRPLGEILHDLNKYSNNQIARQLFLALGKTAKGEPKTLEASRSQVESLKSDLGIQPGELFVDNGSGLSRSSLMSARACTTVLQSMWTSPYMPEYVSSLPISGVDGTMKKRNVAKGFAHIKTGYVYGTRSIAGYVKAESGRYYAICAIINGPEAMGGIPVLDSLISWVFKDG